MEGWRRKQDLELSKNIPASLLTFKVYSGVFWSHYSSTTKVGYPAGLIKQLIFWSLQLQGRIHWPMMGLFAQPILILHESSGNIWTSHLAALQLNLPTIFSEVFTLLQVDQTLPILLEICLVLTPYFLVLWWDWKLNSLLIFPLLCVPVPKVLFFLVLWQQNQTGIALSSSSHSLSSSCYYFWSIN